MKVIPALPTLMVFLTIGFGEPIWAQPFTNNIRIASHFESLQEAIDAAGEQGMLIVDQPYPDLGPLVLPRRFRMVGMGPQGRSVLAFPGLMAGSAITISPPAGQAWVVIENLDVEGPFLPGPQALETLARGIDLTGASEVFLRNLTVRGFEVGVFGEGSLSVHVENSNVSVNRGDNYRLSGESNSWRITGGLCSFAGRAGVNVMLANNTVIDGVRFESNTAAGIVTNSLSTHISHNRFQCDGQLPFCPPSAVAVRIAPGAERTTLLDNLYSGLTVVDASAAETTYRFDNGFPVQIHPASGVDALRIRIAGDEEPEFLVDAEARLRVGPEQGVSSARVTVNADDGQDALRLRTGGITHLLLQSDGQLGVGEGNPAAQLHVGGGSGEDALRVETFGSVQSRLLVDEQGKVVIGDPPTNPNVALGRLTVHADDDEEALRVRVDGTTHFLVDGQGQVGVGTSVPAAQLHVQPGSGEDAILVQSNSAADPNFLVDRQGRVVIGAPTGDLAKFTVNSVDDEAPLRVRVGGTTHFSIDGQGQVGVGTSLPAAQLHVQPGSGEDAILVRSNSAADPDFLVDAQGRVGIGTSTPDSTLHVVGTTKISHSSGNGWRIGTLSGGQRLTFISDPSQGAASNRVTFTQDGNVGIGTTSPDERLHVEGNIKLNGDLVSDGEICIGSGC